MTKATIQALALAQDFPRLLEQCRAASVKRGWRPLLRSNEDTLKVRLQQRQSIADCTDCARLLVRATAENERCSATVNERICSDSTARSWLNPSSDSDR